MSCKKEKMNRRWSGKMWRCCLHTFIVYNTAKLYLEITSFSEIECQPALNVFDIGDMLIACQNCGKSYIVRKKNGDHNGRVNLAGLHTSVFLEKLITPGSELTQHYLNEIWSYNSAMAFASFGSNMWTPRNLGSYCFKIHGSGYHSMGVLYPQDNGQLFVVDFKEALSKRMPRLGHEGLM